MTQHFVNLFYFLHTHTHTHTSFRVKPELLIKQRPEWLEPSLSQNTAVWVGEELSEWNSSTVIMSEDQNCPGLMVSVHMHESESKGTEWNWQEISFSMGDTNQWLNLKLFLNQKSITAHARAHAMSRREILTVKLKKTCWMEALSEACLTAGFFISLGYEWQFITGVPLFCTQSSLCRCFKSSSV